jgi:hypothetical protein
MCPATTTKLWKQTWFYTDVEYQLKLKYKLNFQYVCATVQTDEERSVVGITDWAMG